MGSLSAYVAVRCYFPIVEVQDKRSDRVIRRYSLKSIASRKPRFGAVFVYAVFMVYSTEMFTGGSCDIDTSSCDNRPFFGMG